MIINTTLEAVRSSKELPFRDVLSDEILNKQLATIPHRERIFTPYLTLFAFLSQVISADQSCQAALSQVISYLVSEGKEMPSNSTSAYVQARARLPENILSELTKESAKELEKQVPEKWLWRKRPVKLADGSCVSMPDTAKNQAVYPQPDTQKKGVGFPIARMVAVISLATGMVFDVAMGSYSGKGTGEHALLRQLMHNFNEGDVVLGDCYYASFF